MIRQHIPESHRAERSTGGKKVSQLLLPAARGDAVWPAHPGQRPFALRVGLGAQRRCLPLSKPPEPAQVTLGYSFPSLLRGRGAENRPGLCFRRKSATLLCSHTGREASPPPEPVTSLPWLTSFWARRAGCAGMWGQARALKRVIVRSMFPRPTLKMFSSLENVPKTFHCMRLCLLIFHKGRRASVPKGLAFPWAFLLAPSHADESHSHGATRRRAGGGVTRGNVCPTVTGRKGPGMTVRVCLFLKIWPETFVCSGH